MDALGYRALIKYGKNVAHLLGDFEPQLALQSFDEAALRTRVEHPLLDGAVVPGHRVDEDWGKKWLG